ncbi:MAG: flavodoxin-dependent (E)-4-hydroxy-3-methylbut-2-enyl-diphosphate synthase [Candidatus Marinimicrobia bacterium]|nr:flavodoxin-dependent (E)-4-hydroxy-3-methylbut-2-enyl-diphosphate synthase [Candidatus Neomarinimicrobiota bacterium]MCF7828096.1 flavodoxin-dependent (E)-4-hydroxy-3-methylbut-2-enyl-diphosphate synthase [Candidatus Neomarinimicrobiota bacterium]MCF7879729.1 flavodoxin-dependent (E)-4-hydroxy-3-methylbut-2-enyl-diphosphate synthase [Candidatus Neomarinimicrobiota bacterium]
MSNSSHRKATRQVMVGNVPVGGTAAISVQSMTTTKTEDAVATIDQIQRLEEAGCQIIRVTVPSQEAAASLEKIKQACSIPVVADIHFNHVMALHAVDAGADKIRINPGNIGNARRVAEILAKVKSAGIPIRIGVNAGSLEKDLLEKYGYPTADAMVESAARHIDICREHGFDDIIVSLKASDVPLMIATYRKFSKQYDYPLHLGVTEAGPYRQGSVKSAVGIGTLLSEGIGDTIRVSLADDPVKEVQVGYQILKSLNLSTKGATVVACPTCGRLEVDLFPMVEQVESYLEKTDKTLKVAIMGCAVNGPGEAGDADIGVACGKHEALLFRAGEPIGKIPEDQVVERLIQEIDAWPEEESLKPEVA